MLNGDEVEETEMSGFVAEEQTLHAANVTDDIMIQITTTSARLISNESKSVISIWEPSNKRMISVVDCVGSQILCATGSDLFYLEVHCSQIVPKGTTTLQHEVACLNISPLEGNEAHVAAVGLWTDISVRILTLPSLDEINKELLGGEIIPRSILMTCFEMNTYLLCALGDGSMYYFTLHKKTGMLSDKKKVTLGTQPTVLRTFR